MKSTGIVRKVDEVGRIVLPKELRKTMGLRDNEDMVEFFVEDDKIGIKRYSAACLCCDEEDNVILYNNRNICESCIKEVICSSSSKA